ncbi:MAG: hypothetical protein QOJ98_1522 [Acidobacteriota bacterium]|jgi:hypothetical protein|nr:hypothetical protein [Acidobacteriota bacterium]
MSDDFGTINLRRGERAREIEVLRQHYRQHRDALQRLIADAPTEHLATEYERLIGDIDRALAKLHELEGGAAVPSPTPAVPPPPPRASDPGMRPLNTPPVANDDLADPPTIPASDYAEPRSRLPLIVGAALLALALIAWLIWRASSDRTGATAIVEERPPLATSDTGDTADAGTSSSNDTIEPAATVPAELAVVPVSHDYGTIRKGTRATRQYELSNTTDEPMTINVARSACRCLFYEHAPVIPPKAKENLTVTIDGARAKAGTLHEQIRITSKANAAIGTNIDVNATIQ